MVNQCLSILSGSVSKMSHYGTTVGSPRRTVLSLKGRGFQLLRLDAYQIWRQATVQWWFHSRLMLEQLLEQLLLRVVCQSTMAQCRKEIMNASQNWTTLPPQIVESLKLERASLGRGGASTPSAPLSIMGKPHLCAMAKGLQKCVSVHQRPFWQAYTVRRLRKMFFRTTLSSAFLG